MVTPVRRQYLDMKARHPDAILFFRLGDFYETFDEDAKLVAGELGIQLTSKPMGGGLRSPLAGVPVRSVDQHLARLVEAGHRVAICEQLEDPREARASRSLVRRGVVRVVSPGTALEPALLEAGQASACAAAQLTRRGRRWTLGLAAADITTGQCHVSEVSRDQGREPGRGESAAPEAELWQEAAALLERLGARELVLPEATDAPDALELAVRPRPAADFRADEAARMLDQQWHAPPAAFGLDERPAALGALGALVRYLSSAVPAPPDPSHDPSHDHAPDTVHGTARDDAPDHAPDHAPDRAPDHAPLQVSNGALARGEGCPAALQLGPPRWLEPGARLEWDAATQRALALVEPGSPGGRAGREAPAGSGRRRPRTLLDVLDRCATAPGRRWLRAAVAAPLLDLERIGRRLDRVEALTRRPSVRRTVEAGLKGAPDLERLFARTVSDLAAPPELAALAHGLDRAARLGAQVAAQVDGQFTGPPPGPPPSAAADDRAGAGAPNDAAQGIAQGAAQGAAHDAGDGAPDLAALAELARRLGPAPRAAAALSAALEPEPAQDYGRGVVQAGVDRAVDVARAETEAARLAIAEREDALRAESGIANLKVSYHRTFGYLIDVPRSQTARAPEHWQRRQSLRDRERFTEPALLGLERTLEAAEAALAAAERAVVDRLRAQLTGEAARVREIAGALARLDAAAALARAAAERGWTRPELDHTGELEIEGGRHPVVEAAAAEGAFVPNDLRLSDDGVRAPQLLLVTGPNMAGKSTYLRQQALIVVLAQLGSFVPARRARVGLVDRIFARVGAHDDLAEGRSTFMVEMLETARLLRGATDRSLLLLDEIGRGTSTWDGLAIAQAVTEALAGGCPPADDARARSGNTRARSGKEPAPSGRGPRTLFATHFHELTALAGQLPRVSNCSVQVEERADGGLEFRYQVAPGAADRSYGVQVAAQAGLPQPVVARAAELLAALERGPAPAAAVPADPPPPQLMLMPPLEPGPDPAPPWHPLVHDLADLDVDGITPLEAISALYALRDEARNELRGRRDEARPQTAEAGS